MKNINKIIGTLSYALLTTSMVLACNDNATDNNTGSDGDNNTDNDGGGSSDNNWNEITDFDYDFTWKNNINVTTPITISELQTLVPNYYSSLAESDTGDDLFKKLQDIQSEYTSGVGSYGDLWETYKTAYIDKYDENDNTIFDLYGEIPNGTDAYKYQPGTDQDRGSGGEGDAYNREHIIPQSYFRSSSSNERNIKNDAHFTWPADKGINSSRSNNHFDEVESPSRTYAQGGKYGNGTISGTTSVEPADWFKGDVARTHFHFLVTWIGDSNFQGNEVNAFKSFKTKANMAFPYFSNDEWTTMYRTWSVGDKIDRFNIESNNEIARLQGGLRNPFIDMPQLATRIWG